MVFSILAEAGFKGVVWSVISVANESEEDQVDKDA